MKLMPNDIEGRVRLQGGLCLLWISMGLLFVGLMPQGVFANTPPTVTNVTVSQRTDGSKKVDIRYNLWDDDNDKCTVSVQVSNDGGSTWTVSATSFTGAIGANIARGSNKLIVWDAGKDLPGVFGSNYRIKVTADDGKDIGLIAYYPFNGNTNDYSGHNRHASGQNYPEYVAGRDNQAIRLVGSGHVGFGGSYVLIPYIPLNEYPDFTISLWVNHQGDTSSYGHGEAFIFFGSHIVSQSVSIMYSGYFPNCSLTFGVGDKGITSPYPPNFAYNWNHICLIKNSNNFIAYVNGVAIGSNTSSLSAMQQTAGLGLHWWSSSGGSNRFIGALDEVRIYNRALSEAEITYLYQNP